MGKGSLRSASAASAYRKGNPGRQMGQSTILATSANPLVQRQSLGRQTSDRKSGQTHPWGRWRNLGYPKEEDASRTRTEPKRVSTPAITASLHSKEQRSIAPFEHSRHERSSHAGLVSAGPDPVAETLADPNSFGFRKERCQADAIAQCFINLARKHMAEWILEGDIKSCFDRISHQWLLDNIPMEKTMLHKWLKAGYMEEHRYYPTKKGVPQGGIISPVIANMALDGLEKSLRERVPKRIDGQKTKVNLVRFADDFIITGCSKIFLEENVRPLVEQFLQERGLELSAEKTTITHIQDGFDFLGQNLRKYDGKLIIKPSKKSIRSLLEKVRLLMKANPQAQAANLIRLLNPIIRGWAQYHRHVVSKAVFSDIDHRIFYIVWQWTTRRHPNKSAHWVRKSYFHFYKGNNWTFSAKATDPQGKQQRVYLFAASQVPIRRHIKIRAQANPYDPTWETYFEKRIDAKMVASLTSRKQLLNLWKSQQGICPVCSQKITSLTGWHSHHIVWRSKGGSDLASNRILLHPNCHQQVHNLNISVGKPRPSL